MHVLFFSFFVPEDVRVVACPPSRVSATTVRCVQTLTSVKTVSTRVSLITTPSREWTIRDRQLSMWDHHDHAREPSSETQ